MTDKTLALVDNYLTIGLVAIISVWAGVIIGSRAKDANWNKICKEHGISIVYHYQTENGVTTNWTELVVKDKR